MSDEFDIEFSYDASSRKAILEAVDVSDPDICEELIAECEAVSRVYLSMISYWRPLPNIERVDDRINRILDLIKKAYDLTMFDDETDIAEKSLETSLDGYLWKSRRESV